MKYTVQNVCDCMHLDSLLPQDMLVEIMTVPGLDSASLQEQLLNTATKDVIMMSVMQARRFRAAYSDGRCSNR